MGNTPGRGFRFPELGDDNNPPADIQALALDVEAELDDLNGSVANAAALPASGEFVGQRVLLLDTFETAMWTGSAWLGFWKPITSPSWGNVTLGTGPGMLNAAEMLQVGKRIDVKFRLVLGVSGAVTGAPNFGLPQNDSSGSTLTAIGQAILIDASAGAASRRAATIYNSSAGQAQILLADNAAGDQRLSASFPWTWGEGDSISGSFSYRAA